MRVAQTMDRCELGGYSAQLAYYFFLSLFPTLLFVTSLLSYLPIARHHGALLALFERILPAQAMTLVRTNLETILHSHKGGLLSFGALFALYTAGNALIAIGQGLNRVFDIRARRSFLHARAVALALTLTLAVLWIMTVALFFLGPRLMALTAARFGWVVVPAVVDIVRWPVIVAILLAATALIYRFAADTPQDWHWVSPGSLFAVGGWIGASALFAFYVSHFGSYNRMYGSIGAVIVLLTWMYLSGWLLLAGASIDAVLAGARGARHPGKHRHPS